MSRRKNALTRQVRRAYSQSTLSRILTLPENEFGRAFGMTTTEVDQHPWSSWSTKKGKAKKKSAPNDYYHFRDNGASVLAVAHLDTVVDAADREPCFYTTPDGPAVVSGALDDRLGAYVILELLPRLGVTCDHLLTVGEESGQSTASFFTPEKDYDHIIEFDRMGTDVVMYQYENEASRQAVQASGARVGSGSFSDISYMEQLEIKAFNWGVGYRGNYHSTDGYAILPDTFAMVAKYLRFHAQNAGITMPHEPKRYSSRWEEEAIVLHGGELDWDCDLCNARNSVDAGTLICAYCLSCFVCGKDELECKGHTANETDAKIDDAIAELS